jgi:hypothetical protein
MLDRRPRCNHPQATLRGCSRCFRLKLRQQTADRLFEILLNSLDHANDIEARAFRAAAKQANADGIVVARG